MGSLFTGVAGMIANQQAVDVIANNIANMNTVAFKAGRPTFAETLQQTLYTGSSTGLNPMQVGMGASIGSINTLMTQGNLRPTGRQMDVALVGDAFLMVVDGNTLHFTRDGVLQLDAQNRLVNANSGLTVAGWQADIYTGVMDTTLTPANEITIPLGAYLAIPTSNAFFGGNLDATTAVGGSFATPISIYDSLGTLHSLDVTFTKTAANTWGWVASSTEAAGGTTPGSGTITFNTQGAVTSGPGAVSLDLASANGATDPVNFTLDFSSISQLDGASTIQATRQDGLPMGQLTNFSIDVNGQIIGSFSNGVSRVVAQIAVARFTNPSGLLKEGVNLWGVSASSGMPSVQTADAASTKLRSGYVEMSNVDLANEFANLIVTQRGFQANSRSITTSDEMLQDLMQLKR
ncbi:MAG: flagellar hook protein FlgE [Armatimonadota bacterium]